MESDNLRKFLLDVRDDLADALAKAWTAHGNGARLLQWLTSREVLTAVEAESALSAGQPRRQSLALLDLVASRSDVRRVWTPFWHGFTKFCPQDCVRFYDLIEERLGVQALPGKSAGETKTCVYASVCSGCHFCLEKEDLFTEQTDR